MKYKILILLVMIAIFTGCGKNKLTCEKSKKNPGYIYSEKYELVYDKSGENLKQINLTLKSDYNEQYTLEEIEKEYNELASECDFYESASNKLVECKPELSKDVIIVKIKIKVANISDELFEQMMYVTKSEISKKKDTKKMLENVGYTCR